VSKIKKEFLMGNEIIVQAAVRAGAQVLCGYPITPTTDILHYWLEVVDRNPKIFSRDNSFLQTEDEMAAGFAALGAILMGKVAFTATAGPGNVLMQDAFSMAENLRLPIVAVIGQRGGPSTGTVIYSQQELNLTCFGGNGEGLRIVYSPATLDELYKAVGKAFEVAWKYRFPTFVLTDGYLCKAKGTFSPSPIKRVSGKAYFKPTSVLNLRNCYDQEEELGELVSKNMAEFQKIAPEIAKFEEADFGEADVLVLAHGSVGEVAKLAVSAAQSEGRRVNFWRPITLNPFPQQALEKAALKTEKILVVESSAGQFSKLIKQNLYNFPKPIFEFLKPAVGFDEEEILEKIREVGRG